MKFEDIKKLVDLIDASKTLTELNLEQDEYKIVIKKEKEIVQAPITTTYEVPSAPVMPTQQIQPQTQPNTTSQAEAIESGKTINAPMVGTFYKSPSPESAPYVSVGDKVNADSTVCILEAMKLFNEIQAEISGEIVEILVEDGQMVEYGQPLFKVK
ncbi:acetyl-CoA carboxylase biotin carboxyl carrier protein [Macrococcoides goetzii]|nr:acetyl-CoA carboxylase biotin carboxyl carrier protein [Macrococcus goetzii]TDM42545.1 acetyl-CoA carboxylase biotin carboxyl carrier protein [Macrococcus goetzii]TDM46474.1 acetyl-CoA carboxylase biotin carboxyl carrier protein [Macrococcus goetzii]TDM50030.1 acetyl-CoA carboxylase biotin carboxyl carrier protein [Macrococcus goetzii]